MNSDNSDLLRAAVEPAAYCSAQIIASLGEADATETFGFSLYDEDVDFVSVAEADGLAATKGLAAAERVEGYPVWFATDREPVNPVKPELGFTNDRSTSGVHYGRCVVQVPKSHEIGSLGSNFLVRVLRRTDDRLAIQKIEIVESGCFWRDMAEAIRSVEAKSRHAVVFVHGYNVSFESAALRAAQLGYDLGISGVMAFFSWPSRGSLRGYFADSGTIEASTPAITDFLVSVATLPGVEHVHLIAHSMGNRGTLAAMARIAAAAERLSGRTFDEFILAAADVDAQVFRDNCKAYRDLGKRTTLYVSPRDRALALSKFINGFTRAGFVPPVGIFNGVETIDVGKVDLEQLGHGYVGNSRGVLADIHSLIFEGTPVGERFGIERVETEGGTYYAFKA